MSPRVFVSEAGWSTLITLPPSTKPSTSAHPARTGVVLTGGLLVEAAPVPVVTGAGVVDGGVRLLAVAQAVTSNRASRPTSLIRQGYGST
jgi:hypothetical protein